MSHPSYREVVRSMRAQLEGQRDILALDVQDCQAHDTTHEREHILRQSEMLQALLELHPQAAAIADAQGLWVVANRAFGRLFGLSTSLNTLPARWRDHFRIPLRMHDRSLWHASSGGERPVMNVWFEMYNKDGVLARFLAHGTLLDRKSDGNLLLAWTFFESGTRSESSSPDARSNASACSQSSPCTALVASDATVEPPQQSRSHQRCHECSLRNHEALKLIMLHTNEQKRDLEKRIAENYLLTVIPLIEHLKSTNLPPSQAYLLETLEFNLRHINSVFRIKVRAPTKRLSTREMEICQMIRAGKNSGQIAEALGLQKQTVMVHRKHIRRKLGLSKGSARLAVFLQTNLDPFI